MTPDTLASPAQPEEVERPEVAASVRAGFHPGNVVEGISRIIDPMEYMAEKIAEAIAQAGKPPVQDQAPLSPNPQATGESSRALLTPAEIAAAAGGG